MAPAPSSSPAEILRTVAHELCQPLSSIASTAYYMSLVLPSADAKLQEHLTRIQDLIEQSNWILSNGLRLADPVEPSSPQPIDLEEIITEAVSHRRDLRIELSGNLPLVRLDPARARALVEGLLILFRQIATADYPATLRTRLGGKGGVLLEIASSVPGYHSESALAPGSKLEIDSARQIAESHGGSLECQVDPATGVRLRAVLL
jgi:hypothetical protein